MKIQAEISLYPLRQRDLTRPIQQFIETLENYKLKVETGPMSSIVWGDSQAVFKGLQKAFEQVGQQWQVVVTAKISNACPGIEI